VFNLQIRLTSSSIQHEIVPDKPSRKKKPPAAMAVIWGLDLKDMQWGKFKGSYMWNNEYHLRRTKFIVYQLAMILCVVSESLGTDVLSSS
jgi:hypothetical protein